MRQKKEVSTVNISFLDLLSGALGAVIILFVSVPKAKMQNKIKEEMSKPKIEVAAPIIKDSPSKASAKAERSISSMTQEEVDQLKSEIQKKDELVTEQIQEIKNLKEIISKKQEGLDQVAAETKQSNTKVMQETNLTSTQPVDVGFKFKGKRVLFLIDISGSMLMEDRIGQVKAGLKMLITTMSEDFKIDVVSFPSVRGDTSYSELWGTMKEMTQTNKNEVYEFLIALRPNGPTPTRDVLKYAFSNYYGVTDIVLLTDGAPTRSMTRNVDDIYNILYEVTSMNNTKIQINSIGVGSDFLRDKNNIRYIFLDKLSRENNGFFVGF